MSTLAQMRSRIADDINRSNLSTQIDKAINRAIEFYESERFWFNETSGTFSTVASQESYGSADNVPSTLKEILRLEVTISSNNNPALIPRTFDWIRRMNVGAATGTPSDYAWYQSKIYLSPIPDSIKTITVYYGKNYAAFTADSDTNDFTTDAEDLIEARARWWVQLRILNNKQKADFAKEEEMEALRALRKKTRILVATNCIEPTSF